MFNPIKDRALGLVRKKPSGKLAPPVLPHSTPEEGDGFRWKLVLAVVFGFWMLYYLSGKT